MQAAVKAAIDYVQEFFRRDASGHDAQHTLRVCRTALRLAEAERADRDIVALAALLHDVDDRKISPDTHADCGNAVAFLCSHQVREADIARIIEVIRSISFSENGGKIPATIEGRVVQDADRLDAIGAIGIARTFAYGGAHGRNLGASIQHFHDKLLLLADMMTTDGGRRMASERHAWMEAFLREYQDEAEGVR